MRILIFNMTDMLLSNLIHLSNIIQMKESGRKISKGKEPGVVLHFWGSHPTSLFKRIREKHFT